ncbi:unnamed protein product [Pocillopora meandrina]|uniref:Uncharacterized protein n=1 Tax=Pocillopora meandrina TaxID=46732 RepID=A0AAU9X1V9_9CNID|nr:unnamed protein product [Pocillopora meandrina]
MPPTRGTCLSLSTTAVTQTVKLKRKVAQICHNVKHQIVMDLLEETSKHL